jgi:hypothetical protein
MLGTPSSSSRTTPSVKGRIKLSVTVGHVLTLRGRKIARSHYFGENRAACLEAAGLSA